MRQLNEAHLREHVTAKVDKFRKSLLKSLKEITLEELIRKKNPYLLLTICGTTGEAIMTALLDWISSSRESKFGGILEDIGLFVAGRTKSAYSTGSLKSGVKGLDYEFVRNGIRMGISSKSGGSWGNSQSSLAQNDQLKGFKNTVTGNIAKHVVVPAMGIFYGKTKTRRPSRKQKCPVKFVGQNFWTLLGGDPEVYVKVLEFMRIGSEAFESHFYTEMDAAIERLQKALKAKEAEQPNKSPYQVWLELSSKNYDPNDTYVAEYIELCPNLKITSETAEKSSEERHLQRRSSS